MYSKLLTNLFVFLELERDCLVYFKELYLLVPSIKANLAFIILLDWLHLALGISIMLNF